jgi:Uma2 family endonuclease
MAGFRKFSVAEYHKLTEIGILTEDDDLELLEGYLVQKMPRNPPHDGTLFKDQTRLTKVLPPGWILRCQMAVTLDASEPEPDLAVVVDRPDGYMTAHPYPADIGLVVEVADSTVTSDRLDKGRIYARNRIPVYWIINLIDGQVEVYESPSGPGATPAYGKQATYHPGSTVPFVLNGQTVASVPVADLLP